MLVVDAVPDWSNGWARADCRTADLESWLVQVAGFRCDAFVESKRSSPDDGTVPLNWPRERT